MKQPIRIAKTLIAVAVTSVIITGCATTAIQPEGASDARNKLTQLQSDSQLSTRAPVAIKDAELAVRAAEQPQEDKDVADHLVYMADRKIDIARALAQSRLIVSQRELLSQQRANAQLEARNRQLANALKETDAARMDTIAARKDTIAAREQAADLQRQITELNARPTERGLVVTLGDVLFDTNKSDLKSGTTTNLAKLAAFLNKYSDRSVLIEGHTDNTGSDAYNLDLSQRRADSVKSWLVGKGVGTSRISTYGMGEGLPVAGNDSAAGRQLNRRVEVIIENSVVPADGLVMNLPK
jgi:outer membrane protein OmpA-like peptidoglycan-associated protein